MKIANVPVNGDNNDAPDYREWTPYPLDAEVKQAMMRSADESHVLTNSTKFGQACLTTFARLAEIHVTTTDFGMPTEFAEAFTNRGVRFRVVNV